MGGAKKRQPDKAPRIATRMSDRELDDERKIRRRASVAARTEDEEGFAHAEEQIEDAWGDFAPEQPALQLVKLDDGAIVTEVVTEERKDADEEQEFGDEAPGVDAPEKIVKAPRRKVISQPQPPLPKVRPKAPQRERPRKTVDEAYVRCQLDRAKGQRPEFARDLIRDLVEDCSLPCDLGKLLNCQHYEQLLPVLNYVRTHDVFG
jgi:hypothetical protein